MSAAKDVRMTSRGKSVNIELGSTRPATEAGRARRQPSRTKLRTRLHASLLALDLACIVASFYAAKLLYPPFSEADHWWVTASVFVPIYVGAALNAGAYATASIEAPGRGVARAMQAFAVAAGTVILVAFYLKASASFSRVGIAIGSSLSIAALASARYLFLRKAREILGGNPYSTVLISDHVLDIDTSGFSLVIPIDAIRMHEGTPEMYHRLALALQDSDRVIVDCSPDNRTEWVQVLKGAGIQSEIVAPELLTFAPLGLGNWHGMPTLIVADGPLTRFDSFVKRSFDIATALLALIVLSPVMIATALLVKLESPGPVFFVQTRIGLGNRKFKMLKFRSMRIDQSDGGGRQSTQRNDDRVTRVGAIIRKTSIDELPQLINVLLGDMSVVGPRPHALESRAEDKLFWEIDERYWHRHAAKPGLTGLAQVRGYRGATVVELDLTNRLQADLEYLANWSIWRDLYILMLTVRVLVHKNAY